MDSDKWEDLLAWVIGGGMVIVVYIIVSFLAFAVVYSVFDLPTLVAVALILVPSMAITAGLFWALDRNDMNSTSFDCSTVMLTFFLSGVVVAIAIANSVLST